MTKNLMQLHFYMIKLIGKQDFGWKSEGIPDKCISI